MVQIDREATLRELFRSLDQRWRPEAVARKLLGLIELDVSERAILSKAVDVDVPPALTWMTSDFSRPRDMSRQLKVAQVLFGKDLCSSFDNVPLIEQWLEAAEQSIGKQFGRNDFRHDRLPKVDRKTVGIDISRRQYNKRFRLASRLEGKARRLAREQLRRSLTLASKNRLASRISWEDFATDLTTAAFISYYVARCNLRSVFTNTTQVRPYDEICAMLMKRCESAAADSNWWAIAHVLPNTEILRHLDAEQQGVLLAQYFEMMNEAANLLKQLWQSNDIQDNMIVQRGNDSSTWNLTAGAWNKLRDGWFSLMYALGMTEAVEQMCPGKVLRLMAADVARWHQQSGGSVHPDTFVWKEVPRPWEVISGEVACTKAHIEAVCAKLGIDPIKSAWSAPKPGREVVPFIPTPELVHGVKVASPLLAQVFRKAGVFSGKRMTAQIPVSTVDEIRARHWFQQEQRRKQAQANSTAV